MVRKRTAAVHSELKLTAASVGQHILKSTSDKWSAGSDHDGIWLAPVKCLRSADYESLDGRGQAIIMDEEWKNEWDGTYTKFHLNNYTEEGSHPDTQQPLLK